MSSTRMGWVIVGCFSFFVLLGCKSKQPEAPLMVGFSPPLVMEHKIEKTAKHPTKEIGEDCTQHGYSECLSGFCLHARAEHNAAYFCSRPCESASDCPREWSCEQVHPGARASMCTPPDDWRSARAETPPKQTTL